MERNQNFHYWTLERFSLRFSFYAIIDTEEYMADQLFVREQVRVWFGHEFASPDSPYRVIFCKCRKKDAEAFERALEALPNKMLLCGHRDYITYCENLKRKMEQARDHGGDPNDETVCPSA